MVVFRCECEEVLAVEENSGDRLGECPSCGVIVRVPTSAVNLKGKLRRKAAASQAMKSVPAAPPIAAAVAEPEPIEAEAIAEPAEVAEAIEAPAEVQEAAFDAEIADLRANTVPAAGHAVEETLAKHSEDEVSAAQEAEPIGTPEEVPEIPQEVAEQPQEIEPTPDVVPEVTEAPLEEVQPVEAVAEVEAPPVEEAPAENIEEAPMDTAPGKKKLSKRERLKLKKKNRGFEDAPVAEEAVPVEAPVAEVTEAPPQVEEVPAQVEEPVAVVAEEAPAVEESPAAKSRSGLKSGIKKPLMGVKGKAAIGAGASSARKGVAPRAKKEAGADGDAPKKGKSMLFVIGALVLAGAGVAAWYVMREPAAEAPKNGAGETKKEAPTEEKKTDEAPAEPKKEGEAKAEEPKADAPKEEPKADAPKADAKEEPKADAPKAAPKSDGTLPKETPTAPAE